MKRSKSFIILFLGLLLSLYNFLYGFLINRSEIYEINSCDSNNNYCKYSPYKRIVILLVDALKYEFIDPQLPKSNYLHGNLDIIRSLINNKKSKYAFVSHFLSDPPTTTLQRIKGITTGSLPTFIDISTNFGSTELLEDNILNQWKKSGFDLKFAGDATWTDLFPTMFNVSIPYPSFNIKDLDTTDKKVEDFMLKFLSIKTKGSNTHPEIILGHMLGIDHCGHTFGRNNHHMKRKLIELNEFIKHVVKFVDKETLFVMFGDHGMTATGDHGGDSADEVDAGLFVLSGRPLNVHKYQDRIGETVSQIDLVSTLAAMTGVAIPFSNLGVIRHDLLTSVGRARYYVDQNVKQITKYINSYEAKFGDLKFPNNIKDFLQNPTNRSTEDSINMLQKIKEHFQSKWAQFNVPLIYSGIISFFLFIIAILNCLIELRVESENMTIRFFLHLFYFFFTAFQIFTKDTFIFLSLFGILITIELFYLFKNRVHVESPGNNKLHFVVICIGFLYTILSFSNSFIVSEDRIVQFFLQTILLLKAFQSVVVVIVELTSAKSKASKSKHGVKFNFKTVKLLMFILTLLILGSVSLIVGLKYKICREEQRGWCSSTSEETSDKLVQVSLFFLPILIFVHRIWLRHCGNLASMDANVILVKFLLPFSGLCLFFFHAVQFADETSAFSEVSSMITLVFPRIVVITSLFVLIGLSIKPLLMLHRNPMEFRNSLDVPSLFKYLQNSQSADKSITVHGLATVYSSVIFTGLLSTCIFVSVFLKVQFAIGIVSTVGVLLSYSILTHLSTTVDKDNILNSLSTCESVIFMTILSQFGFFATGHQATISNIPWYSVFIGWKNDHQTRLIPAIMLNMNLFSAQIVITLFGLLLPLFVLLISLGPANPFDGQQADKKPEDNIVSSVNCGEFYLFKSDSKAIRFRRWIRFYYLFYVIYHSVVVFCVILSTGFSRRHLMAWKIFVPKMIYSVMNLLVVYLTALLSYVFVMRTHRLTLSWRCKNI